MFDHLLGNPLAKAQLKRLLANKTVPPVLLFHGPDGIGKGLFAQEFAQTLTNNAQADLHIFHPEGKNGQHPIAAMRRLIEEAGMPPFQAPCKVFILHDAEKMLASSSNALLKTLEEPHPHSQFILTTSRPHELLPTILSRCQKVPFFSIAENEIIQLVPDSHIATLSEGSIAKALLLSKKPKQPLVEELFKAKTYPEFLHALSKIEEPGEEDDRLSYADLFFEEILFHIRTHFPSQLEKTLPLIQRSRQALFHHVKLKTVLENFFIA